MAHSHNYLVLHRNPNQKSAMNKYQSRLCVRLTKDTLHVRKLNADMILVTYVSKVYTPYAPVVTHTNTRIAESIQASFTYHRKDTHHLPPKNTYCKHNFRGWCTIT